MSEQNPWSAPTATGPVRGSVSVPGSKSLTNRLLLLAALADGPGTLTGALRARDTELMLDALQALGTLVVQDGDNWTVTPAPWGPASLDVGNAGTATRFLTAAAGLAQGAVRIDGDARMRERPLGPLTVALRSLGVDLDGDQLPLTVHGQGAVRGGEVTLDASSSSQLVSALLLAGAAYEQGCTLRHVGPPVPSTPHLQMSVTCLRDAGVVVDDSTPDRWVVAPATIRARDVHVEPDLSNATPFLAAAAATAGEVTVAGWPRHTTQPGALLPGLLEQMGCTTRLDDAGLTVRGPDRLQGLDADLREHSEAVPVLAALAAAAHSPSHLRGVGHMRGHETDRLAALAQELGRAGAGVRETSDGLAIVPAALHSPDSPLDPRHDHRLVMAYAVLGLVVPGVLVSDLATVGKTFPDFAERWVSLVS